MTGWLEVPVPDSKLIAPQIHAGSSVPLDTCAAENSVAGSPPNNQVNISKYPLLFNRSSLQASSDAHLTAYHFNKLGHGGFIRGTVVAD